MRYIVDGNPFYLEEIAAIEAASYPEAEAASLKTIRKRIMKNPFGFWILVEDGHVKSFVNGLVTNERDLTDEMYEHPEMNDPEGDWLMIFSLATDPAYRHKGYAVAVMQQVISDCDSLRRKGIVLTCKEEMIPFYSKFGFEDEGISTSVHGGAKWHQMRMTLQ